MNNEMHLPLRSFSKSGLPKDFGKEIYKEKSKKEEDKGPSRLIWVLTFLVFLTSLIGVLSLLGFIFGVVGFK